MTNDIYENDKQLELALITIIYDDDLREYRLIDNTTHTLMYSHFKDKKQAESFRHDIFCVWLSRHNNPYRTLIGDGCDGCKFVYCAENEYPCNMCSKSYMNLWTAEVKGWE